MPLTAPHPSFRGFAMGKRLADAKFAPQILVKPAKFPMGILDLRKIFSCWCCILLFIKTSAYGGFHWGPKGLQPGRVGFE